MSSCWCLMISQLSLSALLTLALSFLHLLAIQKNCELNALHVHLRGAGVGSYCRMRSLTDLDGEVSVLAALAEELEIGVGGL